MGNGSETTYWLTRLCLQKSLGVIYLIGFLILVNQGRPLIGSNGLLPARLFLQQVKFWDAPSIFWLGHSDRWLMGMAWIGVLLSLLAISGYVDQWGLLAYMALWGLLWILYLSFVNIGQVFYGFGWETLLLETGFLAIFLAPAQLKPPVLVIWLLRWVLFRVMFGAGLIKLRGDPCWRDLTCMFYHYETQPVPHALSWYFHHLPPFVHRFSVLFTHFVELAAPFGLFGPRPVRHAAGVLMVVFQVMLILSGNLSWLNYITLVLCIACFDDTLLSLFLPWITPPASMVTSGPHQWMAYALTALVLALSVRPTLNLISPRQAMNRSFDSLHLVNTYGAFGSVTKTRYEVILEGTDDALPLPNSPWRAYEFKVKPGDPAQRPRLMSPYHYRLDWQIWFAAMSSYEHHPWILNLVSKLLQGDGHALGLLRGNPFPDKPPRYVRASLYEYHFVSPEDKSGNWWQRTYVGEYLPALSLDDPAFRRVLMSQGWLE